MTPYEQGFVDKCAELGVDPQALVKSAVSPAAVARAVAGFLGAAPRVATGIAGRGARAATGATARGAAYLLPPRYRDAVLARMMSPLGRMRQGLPAAPGFVRVPGSRGRIWQRVPDSFGERLAQGGTVSHGTKSVDQLLRSPRIGAPTFAPHTNAHTFDSQLERLDFGRQFANRVRSEWPGAYAPDSEYALLRQIIENARRNAAPGQAYAM